jgi:hypothetical protein
VNIREHFVNKGLSTRICPVLDTVLVDHVGFLLGDQLLQLAIGKGVFGTGGVRLQIVQMDGTELD